jgi:ribosomal protein S18 acetylase RimI-like enzyme
MGQTRWVVEVREAELVDYEPVAALVVDAYRTLGDEGDAFYETELRDVASRAATGTVLVAVIDGKPVGTVTLVAAGHRLAEVDDPEAATIRMLGVDPAARGQGVGEALVRACIDRATRAGAKRIRLDTRTSMLAGQRLYQRLGFERDPAHDWSPTGSIRLLAFVLDLSRPRPVDARPS